MPDLAQFLAGASVDSADWVRVAEALNLCHAEGNIHRWSQTYSGGICAVSGAVTMAWPIRLPLLSWAHQWNVIVEATATVGPAQLQIGGGGGVALINVIAGTNWYSALFPSPAAPATFDTIVVTAAAVAAGGDLGISHISIHAEPLLSPLAVGVVAGPWGAYEPHGTTTLGPDYPLTSARLRSMIEGLDALYQRPRVMYAHAACSPSAAGYKAGANSSYTQRGYLTVPRVTQFADPLVRSYTVWAHVTQQAGVSYVRLRIGGPNGYVVSIPVAAGIADVWVSGSLDLSTAAPVVDSAVTPHTSIDLRVADPGDPAPSSDAIVRSLTVWGV
jgi:hypothetical protein